jgi:hypothetical protein
VPLKINASVPLNDGATPPNQLPGVDQLVAVPVKLFHVKDWACAAGAVKTHASATPSDRAKNLKGDDSIGFSSTLSDR